MYTDKDLADMMAAVETEFGIHLAKAEKDFKLAKSEDESEKKEESKEEPKKEIEHESKKDEGVKDQHQQDDSKEEKNGEEKPESKEARVEEDNKENSAPKEDPHGEAEDHGYDDEDLQHMHSMYSSMSKPELKAHHDCIRKCMDGMQMGKCEDGMAKSEKDAVISIGNSPEVSLLKSELEAAKAQSEEQKKNLDAVTAFLTKFVEKTAPAGKAITSLEIIAKGGNGKEEKPLQKGEIDAILTKRASELTLSKSDRDAINSYYCGGKNIEKVRHLLK
jgi:hypothetical protein